MSASSNKIRPSIAWGHSEEPVRFERPFAGKTQCSPEILSQHCLITGQTGAGKTNSYVKPFCAATLNYQGASAKLPGALVIDPKSELLSHLLALPGIGPRMAKLGENGLRLSFFEFSDPRLSIESKLEDLFRFARGGGERLGADIDHWYQMGKSLCIELVACHHDIWQASYRSDAQNPVHFLSLACVKLGYRHKQHGKESWAQADGSAPASADIQLGASPAGPQCLPWLNPLLTLSTSRHNNVVEVSDLLTSLLQTYGLDRINPLLPYSADGELLKQLCYLRMSVQPELSVLDNPDMANLIDLEPGTRQPQQGQNQNDSLRFSLRGCLDNGGILLYQSGALEPRLDRWVGLVLKEMFSKYVQSRSDMTQPIVYVCDEFHRYVSLDQNHGDTLFLSFCRSYRVMTCLATQSVESLKLALSSQRQKGDYEAATNSLLANIGTKIIMRSNDAATQQYAQSVYPFAQSWQRPHLLSARPLMTLKIGESYYICADGTHGREQINLAPEPAPIPQPKQAQQPASTPKKHLFADQGR